MITFLTIIFTVALVFGSFFLEGWIFMLLANWVFGLFNITFAFTFWQAFGIILLLNFIGGFFKNSISYE